GERLLFFGFCQFTLKPCPRRYDDAAIAPVRWYRDGGGEPVARLRSAGRKRGIECRPDFGSSGDLGRHASFRGGRGRSLWRGGACWFAGATAVCGCGALFCESSAVPGAAVAGFEGGICV